ncbi:hypothetical protein JQ633_01070 [Bradyrhizobium tropiciagri]|uniref:hypothetical protein n=1 Tax=Bradyrhizobium tropiciagri TaxID=312253 RepID=UPI001BA9D1D6|nr:hypothetical protein [Bradyrhizobium tropiciagri]MBR0868932.1 hypothetical protein [Bradyrhizobium tropiciagri]
MFSNDSAEQAAAQRNAGLQQGYDALSDQYGLGRQSLSSSIGQGSDALTTNIGNGNNYLGTSYGMGRDALNQGYGQAANLYQGLINSTGAGSSAYADASGANGAAGLERATQNFQSSPQYGAYGFSLDQGLQALSRQHAAAGNLSSGNADTDAMKYASGLAGQQYANYLQGLSPYLGANANAITGAANVATGQGNALNQSFDAQGNAVNSNFGALGAGLNANSNTLGAGLNTSYQGQGQAANANYTGQGASNAAATMNNYNVGNNVLGAIKTGASLFGAFM